MDNLVTLDVNSPSIQYLVKKDKRLARVIDTVGPISYTPHYGVKIQLHLKTSVN